MIRTQIYLQEAQKAELEKMANQQQRPVAEIIREAVSQYLVGKQSSVMKLLESARGLWVDRTDIDSVKYVEEIRAEMDIRRTEMDLQQTENDIRRTEMDLQQTENDIRRTEMDLQQTENDIRRKGAAE